MKYFTPELMARMGSPDAVVANAAAAEWDQVLERYEQGLQKIRADMPQHLRDFDGLLLHDADVLSIARREEQLIMVLRKDIPPRDVVILTYTLAAEPAINTAALPREESSPVMQFLYDELDVVRDGDQQIYTESILFSNGWEVRLRFRDVRVVVAGSVYPDNGPPGVALAAAVLPQSAQ
jgi:hypothetical protein